MSNLSESGEFSTIKRVFKLLDKWRQLPAYKLQPRADIFFALFLPEVLRAHLAKQNRSIEINSTLIPEFPIKTGSNNRSKRVDYLALSEDMSSAFLVELKTDMASQNEGQSDYLERASKTGLQGLVEDVFAI